MAELPSFCFQSPSPVSNVIERYVCHTGTRPVHDSKSACLCHCISSHSHNRNNKRSEPNSWGHRKSPPRAEEPRTTVGQQDLLMIYLKKGKRPTERKFWELAAPSVTSQQYDDLKKHRELRCQLVEVSRLSDRSPKPTQKQLSKLGNTSTEQDFKVTITTPQASLTPSFVTNSVRCSVLSVYSVGPDSSSP